MELKEGVEKQFELLYTQHFSKLKFSEEIIVAYDGVLNSTTVFKVCSDLENYLKEKKFPKLVIKRAFFLALEIVQNQLLHGSKDEKNTQHNYFICSLSGDQLNFYSVNLVKKLEEMELNKRVNSINKMIGDDKLRESYMQQLTNNQFSEKGGGGLGFLKMALVTEEPIAFKFIDCNDNFLFFNMKVKFSCTENSFKSDKNFHQLLNTKN
jgi:hypothetical protein